ncbi:MAG: lactate dehydrogenase [Atopobiaceae bacterium]|nr:lactate dehydrogenase [Atopobiaceae bacterium]
MKLFAFALREYDELIYLEQASRELGFEFDWTSDYPTLENLDLAEGYDALSIITNPLDEEFLDRLYALGIRGIGTRSIGYEHIDVAYAYKLGMRVANAAYPPQGVANYTIMLMLMALRKYKFIDERAKEQDFTLKGKLGRNLAACTVGIVGTGRIGAEVARELTGFGCTVIACDPYPNASLEGIVEYVTFDELLERADIVTLHAPATQANTHILSTEQFARMKEGAILVNAARGSLVDSQALIAALESGHLGAAALDTIENEAGLYYLDRSGDELDNPEREKLMAMSNVVVSPHMAFYIDEDVRGMVWTSVQALLDFSKGHDSPYEVAH